MWKKPVMLTPYDCFTYPTILVGFFYSDIDYFSYRAFCQDFFIYHSANLDYNSFMKKCYRIENENGEGPFTYTVSKIFTDLQLKCFKGKKHPTPKFTVIDDAYFAFKNRATIDEWFDEAMRKELFKYGWFISVYKVKAYADEDEIQLQFLMAGAKLINTISLDY